MGRALGSTEEKADIIGPHKRPGFLGEEKEALAYGRVVAAAFLPEGTQGSHCTQPSGLCRSCRPGAPLGVSKREGPGYWSRFGDPRPRSAINL